MCEAWKELFREELTQERNKGKIEGKDETRAKDLQALMDSLKIGLEEAMNILKINEDEKEYCRNIILS